MFVVPIFNLIIAVSLSVNCNETCYLIVGIQSARHSILSSHFSIIAVNNMGPLSCFARYTSVFPVKSVETFWFLSESKSKDRPADIFVEFILIQD